MTCTSENKTFTTAPKTWRHGHFISGDRCRVLMQHLWEKGLRVNCSYTTLKYEFIMCFGTNDPRTVEKYIGRPKQILRKSGISMVRMNRATGTTSQYSYSHKRHITRKEGLMQALGYLTWDSTAYEKSKGQHKIVGTVNRYRLNHELLPYFTEQAVLESPPHTPLKESTSSEWSSEGVDLSIDNLRVRNVVLNEEAKESSVEKRNTYREREERESIDNTHANPCVKHDMSRRVCDKEASQ